MTSVSPSATMRGAPVSTTDRGRGIDWLLVAAITAIVATMVRILMFTPIEERQGIAQKIFYVHVPAATISLYLACIPMAIASVLYLWIKDDRLDRAAETFAETGIVFLSVVLGTGPFWGKTIWGTWWQWEARLTSTLFLWFVLVGYLVLRGAIDEREARARLSAIIGTMAGLLVPFIHLTVYMFNTLHPKPVVLKPDAPSLPPEMLTTLLISFAAFALFYAALLRMRYRWATQNDLQQQLEDSR
jgi:heme exporter protein C